MNFEPVSMNAAAANLQNVDVKRCFYHTSSNICKHIQREGLQQRYNADMEFTNTLRIIAVLAFVLPGDIVACFEELTNHIRNVYNNECDNSLDYFENPYIGRFHRNTQRNHSLFPLNMWNMFHRTQLELLCTNNSIEGWHMSFQSSVSACHPTSCKFLDLLKQEKDLNRLFILQTLGGHDSHCYAELF